MSLAELFRLLCNLIRIGTVTAVEGYQARVSSGDNQTNWIRWRADRAGDAVTWHPPSVGEQVIILSPGGEMNNAIIIGSLYSRTAPAPDAGTRTHAITWPDKASASYDPDSGAMTLSGIQSLTVSADGSVTIRCATATVKATQKITLDAPEVQCTKKLTTAQFSASEGGEMNGNFTGSATFNGVKPDNHGHGGVKSGDSWTQGTK